MDKLKGKKVLITGAAAGIGYCTAERFAKAGSELVLTDIDGQAVERAAENLRKSGVTVHTYAYDVSDQSAVEAVAARVEKEVGDIDILINNAGIGYNGELADTPLDTWKKLMNVNFWGTLYHVYAFLPSMKRRKQGQIVNVSSGQAFFRMPTWGAYASIKAALGAFSEILHFELRKHGISVTTVYPFLVNTGFYKGIEGETLAARLSMKLMPYYSMKPETVGRIIFRAVRGRQKVEKVSIINELGYYANFVPFVPDAIAMATDFILTRSAAGEA